MASKLPALRQRLPVVELVQRRIYLIRGQKVMIDADLAELYQVTTKSLNQAVRRNAGRFPEDFMFQLTEEETQNLRSQFVTSSDRSKSDDRWGGRRYLPYAFTEHGVAMLSAVLKSQRAIQMSLVIIRAFVRLRQLISSHQALARKIEQLERTQRDHGDLLAIVVKDIETLERSMSKGFRTLTTPRRKRKPRMGFVLQ
jgi:ORF6N domain-containing protein